MTLLEAVNLSLRTAGQSNVLAINSQHPQVATILSIIEQKHREMQRRGWWFNTGVMLLAPDPGTPDGPVVVPDGVDFAKPHRRYLDYFVRGNTLIDRATMLPVEGMAVNCDIRLSLDWEDLPPNFTNWMANMAALEFASNYDADPQKIGLVSRNAQSAMALVNQEHTKYAKVNLFASGSTGNALAMAYGPRYGTRQR